MTLQYIPMPLYSDPFYSYDVSLESNSYTFKTYYNERARGWFFNLSVKGGDDLVLGERLVAEYPILADYALENLSGFLFLEPVGASVEKYRTDPFELSKWFRLFYIYDDGE